MSTHKNLNILKKEEILEKELENFIEKTIQYFSEVEKTAKETEFVKRESKLTGEIFLLVFVFGVSKFGNPTLTDLVGLLNIYIEDFRITNSGLHKRINEKAVIFFEKMLATAMQLAIPDKLKLEVPNQFSRILIWDSTEFQLTPELASVFRGKGGSSSPAGAKIHFCYDMNSYQWFYHISSATNSDKSMQANIIKQLQPNDLNLTDLGYYNFDMFQGIQFQDAYYLSRMNTNAKVYQRNVYGKYVSIDLQTLVIVNEFEDRFEIPVFIRGKKSKYLETRLIVEKLPEHAVNSKLKKLNKQIRGRGKQLSKRTKLLAKYNFYITNVPRELLPARFCRALYSIRWQIELVFKSWKSVLEIDKINVKIRPERVKVSILAELIFITISSKLIGNANFLLWHRSRRRREISYYKALAYFKNIAEKWFSSLITSSFEDTFYTLQNAVSFIQKHCFKIPQKDRIYPLKILDIYEELA